MTPHTPSILYTGDPLLDEANILDLAFRPASKRGAHPIGCTCVRSRCKPALRWESKTRLSAFCNFCGKPLYKRQHKWADQRRVIGFAESPLHHVDLEELEEMGLLIGPRPT